MKKMETVRFLIAAICLCGSMLLCHDVYAGMEGSAKDHVGDVNNAMGEEEIRWGILVLENNGDAGVVEICCEEECARVENDYYEMLCPVGASYTVTIYPRDGYAVESVLADEILAEPSEDGVYMLTMENDFAMLRVNYREVPADNAGAEIEQPGTMDEDGKPSVSSDSDPSNASEETKRPFVRDVSYDVTVSHIEQEDDSPAESASAVVVDAAAEETAEAAVSGNVDTERIPEEIPVPVAEENPAAKVFYTNFDNDRSADSAVIGENAEAEKKASADAKEEEKEKADRTPDEEARREPESVSGGMLRVSDTKTPASAGKMSPADDGEDRAAHLPAGYAGMLLPVLCAALLSGVLILRFGRKKR